MNSFKLTFGGGRLLALVVAALDQPARELFTMTAVPTPSPGLIRMSQSATQPL